MLLTAQSATGSKGIPNDDEDLESNSVLVTFDKINLVLRLHLRSKERCYKKYKRFKKENDHKEYVRLRRLVKTLILRDYNIYIHLVEKSLEKDPKRLWSYVHERMVKSRFPLK
jgi:hypothetical protein